MNDELQQMLSRLSPEQLQALLGLGSLGEEQDLIGQQMEQAQALQRPSKDQYRTGWGAALGGLGDVLNSYRGARDQRDLQAKQKEILGQKTSAREAYLRALSGGQQQPQQMPPNFVPFNYGTA